MRTLTLRWVLATCAICCVVAAPLQAQDRMPPIPADKLTEAQKKAADAFAEGRGYAVRGPFVPLLRSPDVMLRAKAMGDYLRFKSTIPPRLNELAILLTARHWTAQYEWYAHHRLAMKAGLSPDIAAAIAEGKRPASMQADETVVYDFCHEVLETGQASDKSFKAAVDMFGERGAIDLLGVIGYYSLVAMVLNVDRVPIPDGGKLPLAALK